MTSLPETRVVKVSFVENSNLLRSVFAPFFQINRVRTATNQPVEYEIETHANDTALFDFLDAVLPAPSAKLPPGFIMPTRSPVDIMLLDIHDSWHTNVFAGIQRAHQIITQWGFIPPPYLFYTMLPMGDVENMRQQYINTGGSWVFSKVSPDQYLLKSTPVLDVLLAINRTLGIEATVS